MPAGHRVDPGASRRHFQHVGGNALLPLVCGCRCTTRSEAGYGPGLHTSLFRNSCRLVSARHSVDSLGQSGCYQVDRLLIESSGGRTCLPYISLASKEAPPRHGRGLGSGRHPPAPPSLGCPCSCTTGPRQVMDMTSTRECLPSLLEASGLEPLMKSNVDECKDFRKPIIPRWGRKGQGD